MTKRVACLRFQRVGGCCEPITNVKAGGGAVRFIKLDKDDGRMVYEGELVLGNYEYEFEIDAKTGAVRDWDKDRIDND